MQHQIAPKLNKKRQTGAPCSDTTAQNTTQTIRLDDKIFLTGKKFIDETLSIATA